MQMVTVTGHGAVILANPEHALTWSVAVIKVDPEVERGKITVCFDYYRHVLCVTHLVLTMDSISQWGSLAFLQCL